MCQIVLADENKFGFVLIYDTVCRVFYCSIIMHDCYELWSVCGILKAELKGEISS